MQITIKIDTSHAGFVNADELENLLQKIGERITNGRYFPSPEPYTLTTTSGLSFGTIEVAEKTPCMK